VAPRPPASGGASDQSNTYSVRARMDRTINAAHQSLCRE
jgi:hypothetical protein